MRLILVVGIAACCLVGAAGSGEARKARHHHAPPPAAEAPPQRQPYSFYPETNEGGVPGNLPFNNQIRKHTDPLNANGGR